MSKKILVKLLKKLSIKYNLARSFKSNIHFIWVPKCAGTSVYNMLNKSCNMVLLHTNDNIKLYSGYGNVTFGHYTYKSLIDNDIFDENKINNFKTFAICRSPYTRVVSLYNYFCKVQNYQFTFDYFVNHLSEIDKPGFFNTKNLSQANPQMNWLELNNKTFVRNILRIEEINDLNLFLCKKLGLNNTVQLKTKYIL